MPEDNDIDGFTTSDPEFMVNMLVVKQKLPSTLMKRYTFKTMRDTGEMVYFDDKKNVYVHGAERLIEEQCEISCQQIKSYEVLEVTNHIKRRSYVDRSEFDSNPDILNLENGLLNIHTMEFNEHTPTYLSMVRIPITYDPSAKCPAIMNFLHDALNRKDILTALEFIGYCLYRTAKYEKALMCVGAGDNGKGTFLKLIERFVGTKNTSHVSLQDMSDDRFSFAGLYGKMVNSFADLKAEKLAYTGVFKMLVSGDFIRAQYKHCQPFDFANYAKLIFSANQIPQSDDTTYAYFKRWIIFHFEYTFTRNCRDTGLIDKLTTPEELSGLLNIALIALRKLIKDNDFKYADNIETVEKNYLKDNPIVQFIGDMCKAGEKEYIICRDLYHEYIVYCKDKNLAAMSDNVFGMELSARGIEKGRRRVNHTPEYCYIGVRLRE